MGNPKAYLSLCSTYPNENITTQARTQTFEGGRGEFKGFYEGGANLKKILILRPKLGV